jgi:hypothetical protein
MRRRVYGGGVVAIFPERTASVSSPVVPLCGLPGNLLHASGNRLVVARCVSVEDEEVDVVHCDIVVGHTQAIPCYRLLEKTDPAVAVLSVSQQEIPVVAPMGDMPQMVRQVYAFGSWHGRENTTRVRRIGREKWGVKRFNRRVHGY